MKILGLEKVYFVNDPDFRMESMLSVESLTLEVGDAGDTMMATNYGHRGTLVLVFTAGTMRCRYPGHYHRSPGR